MYGERIHSRLGAELRRKEFEYTNGFQPFQAGILIGKQPPSWFVEIIEEFTDAIQDLFEYDGWTSQLNSAQRILEGMEKRGEEPSRVELSRRLEKPTSRLRYDWEMAFEMKLTKIIGTHRSLTLKQAKEWLEFSNQIGIRGDRTSLLIVDIDEFDDVRKKDNARYEEGRSIGYDEWMRRRRAPVH